MEKRAAKHLALLLAALLFGFFSTQTAAQQSACCVLQNGCQPASAAAECPTGATFLSLPCTAIDSCDFGCCCDSAAADKGSYRNACLRFSTDFQNPPPFPQQFSPFFVDNQYQPSRCDTACSSGLPACPTAQDSCEQAVDAACRCGSTQITQGQYCCAADNVGFNDQQECVQSQTCAPTPTGNKAVRGYVKEGGVDGPAIVGAQMFLGQLQPVFTQSNGAFVFTGVPPGTYSASATRQGYLPTNAVTVQVSTVDVENVIIVLLQGELDTDGDGVSDSTDFCKYEPAISAANDPDYDGSRERRCADNIDNDCDGLTFRSNAPDEDHTNLADCLDTNCLGQASCPTEPLNQCGNGQLNGIEQCDIGIACPTGSSCDTTSCLCIPTTCPQGTNQCTPACTGNQVCSNCQCVSPVQSVCGDRDITGFEECEIGVIPQNRNDDIDENCDGWCGLGGTPNQCLCLLEQSCGNADLEEPEQCEEDEDCGAEEVCSSCQCIAPCEENPAAPELTLDDSANAAQIRLSWELDSTCQLQQYNVYRCTGEDCCEGEGCATDTDEFDLFEILAATSTTRAYTDDDIEPETLYCYIVTAIYQSDASTASDSVCIETQQDFCFDNPGEFCDENKVMRCQNRAITMVEDCGALQSQTGSWICREDGEDADCAFQSNCEECNGVLGLFWPSGKAWWQSASVEGGLADCADISSCFVDYTESSQDQYYSCEDVESCYDYRSEEACSADVGKCGVGPCEWIPSAAYGEVGRGVCRPVDADQQDCSRCHDDQRDAFGVCSQDKCMLYGECYYSPERKVCGDRAGMSCTDYSTAEDCTGGEAVQVNVQWSSANCDPEDESCQKSGKVDAGEDANAILRPSDDLLGLGTCEYLQTPAGWRCVKDADSNNFQESDCRVSDVRCKADNEPPRTTLIPQTKERSGKPLFGASSVIRVAVRDNAYRQSEPGKISTYWCLAPEGQECYPNLLVDDAIIYEEDAQVAGNYRIGYFSEDFSHNLERVRYLDIVLDTVLPTTVISHTATPVRFAGQWFTTAVLSFTPNDNLGGALKCSGKLMLFSDEVQALSSFTDWTLDAGETLQRTYFDLIDAPYTYEYTCTDEAGNAIEGEYALTINADPSISNPLPTGTFGRPPRTFTLSVDTTERADCRIAEDANYVISDAERQLEYYGTMDPANGAGMAMTPDAAGTHHTLEYSPGEVTKPHLFHVRCKFGDNSLHGDLGDVIHFTTDYRGPEIAIVSCDDDAAFDADGFYGEAVQVCFTCQDMVFDVNAGNQDPEALRLNMEHFFDPFGCKQLRYCIGAGDETECETLNMQQRPKSAPVRITESTAVSYTAEDNGGNTATGTLTITVDAEPAELTAEIRTSEDRSTPALDAFGYGPYYLFIGADKNLKRGHTALSMTIQGRDDEHVIPIDKLDEGDRLSVWGFSVNADDEDLYDLDSAATITVTAEDAFGHAIEEEFTFDFRTKASRAPVLEPLLDGTEANGEDYPGYPLYLHANVYYTRAQNLYLTGKTQEPMEILYYVNDRAVPQVRYQQQPNVALGPARDVIRAAAAGTSAVSIADVRGSAIRGSFSAGKFVKFSNHERKNYGRYRHYYQIQSARQINDGESELTLAEPLEQELPFGSTPVRATPYARESPADWFGAFVTLREGANTVSVAGRDAIGNYARPTQEHQVYYDPIRPIVVAKYPRSGTTGDANADISVVVKERLDPGSLLNLDSIAFRINDRTYVKRNLNISNQTNGSAVYYTIAFNPPAPLQGPYEISFSAADYAGNTAEEEWEFIVDPNVPRLPIFTVNDARKVGEKWFADHTPTFTLDFSDTPGQVFLTRIRLAGALQSLAWECNRASGNMFNCRLLQELQPSMDAQGNLLNDEFDLIVHAYKVLEDGSISSEGEYPDNTIVVDTLPPEIVEFVGFADYVRDNQNLTIKLRIRNELHGVDAVLTHHGRTYPLALAGAPDEGYAAHEFRWTIPDFTFADDVEQELPITIAVTDYVGNSDSISEQIYIDLTPPDITTFTIDVREAPVRDPVAGYFATRITTVSVTGTFRDSDVTRMWTEPGSWSAQRRRADPNQFGNVALTTAPPSFSMTLVLNGPLNQETLNQYHVFLQDRAGYHVQRSMRVLADLRPPEVRSSSIS